LRKSVTLYNVIFPVWMLILIPTVWIVVLPANFIIDSLVLLLAFHLLKLGDRKTLYKQSILKVWGFGFLADMIGAIVLLTVSFAESAFSGSDSAAWRWFYDNVTGPLGYNAFKSPYALFVMLLVIAGAGALIYLFNYKVSFKSWPVEDREKKKAALLFAVVTAPYTMLIPASWLYHSNW
jgi:hypothetical protein